jgi:galactonate dehydratase
MCGSLGRVKITDVTTFVIKNPPPSFGGRYFIVVKLTTDTGIVGYGEIYAATFGPHVIASMVDDVAARWVIDQDPNRIELMWRRIYSSGYALRPDPTLVGIMSGLEIACWDIVGKDSGKPVYDLLGGRVHDRLRTYTYLYPSAGYREVYTNPEHAAARAVNEVERGFTALKFDPAGPYTAFDGHMPGLVDIDASVQMIATLRDAVGPAADLLFGTHGQFTAAGAIRLADNLEPFDPLWFEEPCAPDLPREMARVAAHTSIPIATGERLTTVSEFAALGHHQAASIWQPNLGRCGGILAGKKIAAIAEANGCQIAPHLYSGPILGAANIQLAATLPNLLIIEGIREWGGFHAEILDTPIAWEDGYVIPSTEPGLGVGLDETVARAHPWPEGDGGDLHLSMIPDPVR